MLVPTLSLLVGDSRIQNKQTNKQSKLCKNVIIKLSAISYHGYIQQDDCEKTIEGCFVVLFLHVCV